MYIPEEAEFPDPSSEYTMSDLLSENVDWISDGVKFHGTYADDPLRLKVLLAAGHFREARDLEGWQWLTRSYPDFPLVAEKLTKNDNEDIPIRAYYLRAALKRLLELSDVKRRPKGTPDRRPKGTPLAEGVGRSSGALFAYPCGGDRLFRGGVIG